MDRGRLESSIENSVARRAAGYGIISTKWGVDGWPDRVFWLPGGWPIMIEFKRPGEVPTERQVSRHAQLKALGYRVEVHDDADVALQALLAAVEHHALIYDYDPHA